MDAQTFFFSLATGILMLALICRAMEIVSLKRPVPENVKDIYNRRIFRRWQKCQVQCCLFRSVRIIYDYLFAFLVICTDFGIVLSTDSQASLLVKIGRAFALTGAVAVFPFLFRLGEPIIRKKARLTDSNIKAWTKFYLAITFYVFVVTLVTQLVPGKEETASASPTEMVNQWMTTLKWVYTGIAAFFPIRGLIRRIWLRRSLGGIYNKTKKRIDWVIRANGAEDLLVRCHEYDDGRIDASLFAFPGRSTIVLSQALLEKMNSKEVCAVVLHEIGHWVRGGLKQQAVEKFAVDGGLFLIGWIFFEDFIRMIAFIPNPAAGWLIITLILLAWLAYHMIRNGIRQRQELAADAYAAENGFGGPLISALKMMEKHNYSAPNPLPVLWLLKEDHPTLSKRIKHIEACMDEKEEKELASDAS